MLWDHPILQFAAHHRSEMLDAWFRGVTWLGSLYVLTPLAALVSGVLLMMQKYWAMGFFIISFAGASLVAHGSKLLLNRPRPSLHPPLVALPTDSSFPSAHTAQIAGFALALAVLIQRTWPSWAIAAWLLAGLLIASVGLSRIYLQVHYPSDVLGGLLLALLWIALTRNML